MFFSGQRVIADGIIESYYTSNNKAAESSAEREIKGARGGGVTRKMIEFEGSQGRGARWDGITPAVNNVQRPLSRNQAHKGYEVAREIGEGPRDMDEIGQTKIE